MMIKKNTITILLTVIACVAFFLNSAQATEFSGEATPFYNKTAPGDYLPVVLDLKNFGGGDRVDVLLKYEIFDQQDISRGAYVETVALETTAQFISQVPIGGNLSPGQYRMLVQIDYPGREHPAESSFDFTVERKILGVYTGSIIYLGLIILMATGLGVFFGYGYWRMKQKLEK